MEGAERKHRVALHLEDKISLAKVACDLLAKLIANASTEQFLKRLATLTRLSDVWQTEDKDCKNHIEESFVKDDNSNNDVIVIEEDNAELDDEAVTNSASGSVSQRARTSQEKEHHASQVLRPLVPLRMTAWIPCPCDRCGVMCATRLQFNRHVHQHARPDERYSCNACGGEFFRESNFTRHVARGRCVCSICGLVFKKKKNDYKYHMQMHTGERQFQCDVCGKGFFKFSHLTKHSYIHSGHRPYVCKVCSRGFVHAVSLKNHSCQKSRVKRNNNK